MFSNFPAPVSVWVAVAPLLFVCAVIAITVPVYAVLNLRRRTRQDRGIDHRGTSTLLAMRVRCYFSWLLQPIRSLTVLRHFLRALGRQGSDPRLLTLGEGSLFRNITAAGIATAFDFGVVYSLVAATWLGPEAATLCGCAVGGVVNFTINRVWAFGAPGPYLSQGARYTFVSVSSALLNAGGVAVFLLLPNMDYRIAWVIARSAVFITWNYPLHRDFVFVQYRATIAKLDPGRARRDYRWERARRDAA